MKRFWLLLGNGLMAGGVLAVCGLLLPMAVWDVPRSDGAHTVALMLAFFAMFGVVIGSPLAAWARELPRPETERRKQDRREGPPSWLALRCEAIHYPLRYESYR